MNPKIPILASIFSAVIIGTIIYGSGALEAQNYPCKITESNPQGPYYKANAPLRKIFGENLEGQRLVVQGSVFNQNCIPISNVTLDFWQTDSAGNYDNEGFSLRGKIFTNENGEYTLNTIFPEKYSEAGAIRPRHIHVKVSAPEEPTITTQLYFENDPDWDIFVRDSLKLKITEENGIKKSQFDFVIKTRAS